MKYKILWLWFIVLTIGACQPTKNSTANKIVSSSVLYKAAIQNSMYPDSSKISTNLVAINKENKDLVWKTIDGEDYILVVTWKKNIAYYQPYLDSTYYNTGKYQVWVTTAPELLQRMKGEQGDVNQRLVQLLGLPPNATYDYFIEFWVKPEDMFRPCLDKEINDKQCDLCFPSNADSEYITWINESRISRYYQCDLYDQYPWTQLGYTYDWNPQNKSHIGLSEFVIDLNTNIIVKGIYTTEDYLNQK